VDRNITIVYCSHMLLNREVMSVDCNLESSVSLKGTMILNL